LVHFPIACKGPPIDKVFPTTWLVNGPTEEPHVFELEDVSLGETWTAMEALVKDGLVKNIGISNCNVVLTRDLLAQCTIKPAVNQVELHPFLSQKKFQTYMKEQGINVTAYSSFGASSYVELGAATADQSVLVDPVIVEISTRLEKTPAQIALRWAVQ